jgi:hypothetical protein
MGAALGVVLLIVGGPPMASADVEPGEVIGYAERDRLRGLIPEELYALTVEKFPELQITIVETEDYRPHPKYVEATIAHACQASLDERGQLVNYTAGQPFPYSAWAQEATGHACDLDSEDPAFALKLAWNVNFRWFGGGSLNYPHWGQSFGRQDGSKTWKLVQGTYRRAYFNHRSDLLPETLSVAPGLDIEWAEYTEFLAPFDVRGTQYLTNRYLNSYDKRDDAWTYLPSRRRVRRLSTSEKSDEVQGSNVTFEDFFLFSGYVWDQQWRDGEETTVLAPMDTERACFPKNLPGWRTKAVATMGTRDQFESCHFGPYGALPFIDERWQRRKAIRLELVPKRKNHPYGRKLLWYDKQTFAPLMFIAYDPDARPLRIGWYISDWTESSDIPGNPGKRVILPVAYLLVNLQDWTTNRTLFFTANVADFSTAETLDYFDFTRLKKRGR